MYEPLEMGLVSVDQCFLGSGSMVINHRGRQTGKNANTILKKKDGTSLIKISSSWHPIDYEQDVVQSSYESRKLGKAQLLNLEVIRIDVTRDTCLSW